MAAYTDALTIEVGETGQRLKLAAELLSGGAGVIMLENIVALRSTGSQLLCQVVDPMPRAHRCANEYEVLVENARRTLEGSKLNNLLPRLPRKWLVVEVSGAEMIEVWHPP